MKKLKLTGGGVTLVDDEDFGWLNQNKWSIQNKKHTSYARRTQNAPPTSLNPRRTKKVIWIHRAIMDCPKGMQVDHIDGDGLNNQKSNLRICNNSQNQMNRKPRGTKCSIYKGVSKGKRDLNFVVKIGFGGKNIYLGSFKTAKEGALVYDCAAREWFGRYANLNFPLEVTNG